MYTYSTYQKKPSLFNCYEKDNFLKDVYESDTKYIRGIYLCIYII